MNEPQNLEGAGLFGRGISEHAGVVVRPAGQWTRSVHHLLEWLRAEGYQHAPKPVGRTETEERLEFLPGRDQGWPFIDDLQTLEGAYECGRFARELTDALAGYPCPPNAVWQSAEGKPAEGHQVQHGDLGPWNLLWSASGPTVAGVIDWDQAEPGDPAYDIGFLAWFIVPAMDDEKARARGFSGSPDRTGRLRAFAEGSGRSPAALLTEIGQAQQEFIRRVTTRGADRAGGEIWTILFAKGFHESAAADHTYLREMFPS